MSFLYNVQSFSRLSQPVRTFDIDSLIDLFDPHVSYVCMFYHNCVTCVCYVCVCVCVTSVCYECVFRVCVTFVLRWLMVDGFRWLMVFGG